MQVSESCLRGGPSLPAAQPSPAQRCLAAGCRLPVPRWLSLVARDTGVWTPPGPASNAAQPAFLAKAVTFSFPPPLLRSFGPPSLPSCRSSSSEVPNLVNFWEIEWEAQAHGHHQLP